MAVEMGAHMMHSQPPGEHAADDDNLLGGIQESRWNDCRCVYGQDFDSVGYGVVGGTGMQSEEAIGILKAVAMKLAFQAGDRDVTDLLDVAPSFWDDLTCRWESCSCYIVWGNLPPTPPEPTMFPYFEMTGTSIPGEVSTVRSAGHSMNSSVKSSGVTTLRSFASTVDFGAHVGSSAISVASTAESTASSVGFGKPGNSKPTTTTNSSTQWIDDLIRKKEAAISKSSV